MYEITSCYYFALSHWYQNRPEESSTGRSSQRSASEVKVCSVWNSSSFMSLKDDSARLWLRYFCRETFSSGDVASWRAQRSRSSLHPLAGSRLLLYIHWTLPTSDTEASSHNLHSLKHQTIRGLRCAAGGQVRVKTTDPCSGSLRLRCCHNSLLSLSYSSGGSIRRCHWK